MADINDLMGALSRTGSSGSAGDSGDIQVGSWKYQGEQLPGNPKTLASAQIAAGDKSMSQGAPSINTAQIVAAALPPSAAQVIGQGIGAGLAQGASGAVPPLPPSNAGGAGGFGGMGDFIKEGFGIGLGISTAQLPGMLGNLANSVISPGTARAGDFMGVRQSWQVEGIQQQGFWGQLEDKFRRSPVGVDAKAFVDQDDARNDMMSRVSGTATNFRDVSLHPSEWREYSIFNKDGPAAGWAKFKSLFGSGALDHGSKPAQGAN